MNLLRNLSRDGMSIDWLLQLAFNLWKLSKGYEKQVAWRDLESIVRECGYKNCTVTEDGQLLVRC